MNNSTRNPINQVNSKGLTWWEWLQSIGIKTAVDLPQKEWRALRSKWLS